MANVLIADDEANLRKVLAALLGQEGHQTVCVANGQEALLAVRGGGIDILITDLRMPEMDGLELLRAVRDFDQTLPVIMITAHGTVETAVSALKAGAFDYITKPFDKDELRLAVRKAAAVRASHDTAAHPISNERSTRMVGASAKMRDVQTIIEKVAATPSTVLITGESGTGKELVANALHSQGNRQQAPFIKVNCAAIPKDLLESEFFGYEKGAFTGAVGSKPGRFELADGGTLFLDEIAEIPVGMQVKLLRALQEGEFERVGGVRTIKVDVRLIAATNRSLPQQIERGAFREDLYYRLNVVPIALPPLRHRQDDIPSLVTAFIEKNNRRLDKQVTGISAEALAELCAHGWPGNIRELENVIERMVLFAEGTTLERTDLPAELFCPKEQQSSAPKAPTPTDSSSLRDIVKQATVELERDLIAKALEETSGNVTRAAQSLGISRKGLQNKMKEFGLRDSENKA